jgi:hypothetical protein
LIAISNGLDRIKIKKRRKEEKKKRRKEEKKKRRKEEKKMNDIHELIYFFMK